MTARRLQDELTPAKLARLSALVARLTGLHFPEGRLDDLRRGITAAAREFGFADANSFADWLVSATLTGDQVLLLASHLTVGETYFFRDKSSFEVLSRDILPEVIRRHGTDRRLRIWSAGCATGEEPYSIAVSVAAALPAAAAWDVRILATDISPLSLKRAAEAVYGRWAFRDCPPHIKGAFFKEIKKGRFEISAAIKNMVTFAPLNLAEGSFPTPLEGAGTMDVIFCRNVLMYLTEDAAKKAVEVFNICLADSGWLVISAAEASPIIRNRFSPMSYPHCYVYRKGEKPQPPPTVFGAGPEPTHAGTPDTPEVGEPAVSLPPENATPPSETISPEALYGRAEGLFNRGRCADAEEDLSRLLGKEPTDARAMMLLARIHANRGETEAALSWSRKGVAEDKLNPAYHYFLASVLSEHGQFEEAGASLRKALYLDNRFALAHFALGNLARRLGKTGESRRHFSKALALLSKRPPYEVLAESEGMTAGRLAEVVGVLPAANAMKQSKQTDTKEVLRERARALARPTPEERPEERNLEVVVFLLADEKYGIETDWVREVYSLKELTPVPCTPAFVMGIASIRGKITSVIDLKKFFDLPRRGLTELDKVVVIEANGIEVGIHADAIVGLQSIPAERLQPGLPTLTGVREKYLKGVTPERLAVLDAARLLADPAITVNEEV